MDNNMMISAEELSAAKEKIQAIVDNIETVIIGKRASVELVVLALLARGHVLIEDVPGVGKTSLVSSVAKSVDCQFKRIQFTPDLMPSDVTGFSIYNQGTGQFEFREGSVMSNLVLADEINRASAKTQAALLEAMEERQVTVDSQTHVLEEPFMVLATQNPIESFGTYPLPDAQIDRFLLKLSMGYPALDEEQKIIHNGKTAKAQLHAVVSRQDILHLSELADRVSVAADVERYIVEIVAATRTNPYVILGASPRGSISLCTTAKVHALMNGRGYVIPDDVKYMAKPVLGHRITLNNEAKIKRMTTADILDDILTSVVVPS